MATSVLPRAVSTEGTLVRATMPYPLIWDSGDLEIMVEGKVFEVHFKRRYRQYGDPPIVGFGSRIHSAPHMELPYDRLGRVAYTELTIQVPMYLPNAEELKQCVLAVINRLLEVYRYATGEAYINNIPRIELNVERVSKFLREDGTLDDREAITGLDAGGLGLWLTSERTTPITNEARQFLRDATELSVPRVLYLNAKREYIFENYRIAVVEAETAFEALIDQVVGQYYKNQGLSNTQIEDALNDSLRGRRRRSLIGTHIPRCCGRRFVGTAEYRAWLTDLYELRNNIVHDGATADDKQAKDALEAAEQALSWIETHCI